MAKLFEEPATSDNVPFRVASGMAALDASQAGALDLRVPDTEAAGGAFQFQLEGAVRSLQEAGVSPEEFDPETKEIVEAAFRNGNTIGSAWASKALAEKLFPTPGAKDLTDDALIEKIKADGLTSMMDHFSDVFTEEQYAARKDDLARELEDRKILAASGFTGVAAALAAGVLDLPTVVPVGRLATIGKVANTLKATAQGAAAATADAAITEAALHASQTTRTGEESAINIGSATVLGGMLGFSVHRMVGPEVGDKVVGRMDDLRKDASTGFQGARSAGAAQLTVYERIKEQNLDDSGRVFSGGAFGILEKLGDIGQGNKVTSWVGNNLRNPRIDLASGKTFEERDIASRLTFDPSISKRQAAGAVDEGGGVGFEQPVNVAAEKVKFDGPYVDWLHEAKKAFTQGKANYQGFDDLMERVGEALAANDFSPDPVVAKLAKSARERSLGPILKAHQENGNFREEMATRNAMSYFPLIHDADKIRAERPEWLAYHSASFARDLEEDARQALIEQSTRRLARDDAKGVADATRRKTDKEILGEHDENIRALRETRKQEVKTFEERVKGDRKALADARTDELASVKKKFDEELADLKEAQDELLGGSLVDKEQNVRLGSDMKPHEKARLKVSYERSKSTSEKNRLKAEKDVEKRFGKELDKFNTTNARDRKDLSKKFDDLEQEARDARDAAFSEAVTREGADLTVARELANNEGLGALRFVRGGKIDRDLIEKEADALADRYYQSVTGANRFMMDHEISNKGSNYSKFRGSPAWHTELMRRGWAKRNAADILDHYVRNAGVDAAIGKVFKKTVPKLDDEGNKVVDANGLPETIEIGDLGLVSQKKGIEKRYGEMVNSLRSDDVAKIAAIQRKYAKDTTKHDADTVAIKAATDTEIKTADQLKADKDEIMKAVRAVREKAAEKQIQTGKGNVTDPVALERELQKFRTERAKEEAKLLAERDRALENVDLLLRFAKGQDADGSMSSEGWRNTVEVLGGVNYLRLMGGTIASSLGDPVNLVIANGFGNTMKFGIVPMLKNFKAAMRDADGDMRRLARLALANVEAELNARVFAMAEMGNPYATASPTVTFMRNMTRRFSKVSGIQYWNSFWKQVAFNTTHGRIVQNATSGWDKLSKAERTWMLNLGINADGLKKIAAAFDGQTSSKFVDGTDLPIAAFDKWADKEAASLLRSAAHAESHNNVVTPHFSDRMAMMGNPLGRVIMQFRHFMFGNQMRVIGRNIQLAHIDDEGGKKLGVYGGLFGLVMMGAIVDATKHMMGNTTITGGSLDADHSSFDRVIREWETAPGTALYNALDRSSIMGVLGEGSNMLEKLGLPNIRGGLSMAMGDDPGTGRGTSRFASRGVFESVFGPSVGLVEDTAKFASFASGIGSEWLGGRDDVSFNRSDFRRARRLLPGQNAPIIQQLINEGEQKVGTIFDWPNPQ